MLQPPVCRQTPHRTHIALWPLARAPLVNNIDLFSSSSYILHNGYQSIGPDRRLLKQILICTNKSRLKRFFERKLSAKMFGLDPTGVYWFSGVYFIKVQDVRARPDWSLLILRRFTAIWQISENVCPRSHRCLLSGIACLRSAPSFLTFLWRQKTNSVAKCSGWTLPECIKTFSVSVYC